MSKPSNVTAKDLAFERERLTWKRKFRAERENHEKTLEDLQRQLEEKDDLLRSEDDWIERLLEYTELDRDDIAEVVERQKKTPKSDPVISSVVASIARGVMAAIPDTVGADTAQPDRTVMAITDGIDLTARVERDGNAPRLVIRAEGDDNMRELLTLQPYEHDGYGGVVLRVYADVTQTDPTETLDIPVYTYEHD